MKNRTLNKILVVLISTFGCVGVASAEAVDEFATGHWQNGYDWANTGNNQLTDTTWIGVNGYRCTNASCDPSNPGEVQSLVGKAINLTDIATHKSDEKNNTRLGTGSLSTGTSTSYGTSNTAIGYHSLYSNTTGELNTANGAYSLTDNTTGVHNTANGSQALRYNTTGYQNTANGSQALMRNTTGYANTANGVDASNKNTTGYFNNASGNSALRENTTGFKNTASGSYALWNNTTGSYNVGVGMSVLDKNTTGSYNTASGYEAGKWNVSGSHNVLMGRHALHNNSTGGANTVVGTGAGYESQGSGNIFLGYQAGSTETGSNKLYISNSNTASPLIYGDFTNSKLKINGDLKVNTLQDANGVNMIRKVGDVVHIGVNSVTIEDSTTTTSGKDEIGSTINDLQIGTGASHNTTIEGTLTVQTPTADGHAATKSYVDTLTSANTTNITGNTSNISTNTSNITTEATTARAAEQANASNITGNTSNISTNTSNITTEATTARAAEQANAGNITTNASNIGTNTSSINTLTSRMKVDSAGRNNTSIGLNALNQTATGANNTSLGSKAGYSNTAGSRNIFLGYEAGYNETGSDKLYISNSSSSSPLIYGDFASGQVEINGELKVGALQDSDGNNMVRKVGDTIHIGVNSVTIEDATTTTSGKDEIGSTIDELQIGTSASHNTSIVGTLSIQEATADNHAVTRSYVDTQTSGFTSSINSNTSNITINTNDIKNLSTGLAQSMAMASLATPVRGRSSFSIGTGYYDGKSALAYGFAQQNKSGNGLIRIMGASAGGVNSGAASFSWGF